MRKVFIPNQWLAGKNIPVRVAIVATPCYIYLLNTKYLTNKR